MELLETIGKQFGITMGYALIGIIAFAITFWLLTKVVPFSIRKEIEDDHNVALAVVMGAVILGIALIVAAAVHG